MGTESVIEMTDDMWRARMHEYEREIEVLTGEVAALRGQLADADGYIADLEQRVRRVTRRG